MHSVVSSLLAFGAAASLLTVTPGLDTAFVLRTATSQSPQRAALAGLGIVTGCLIWAALVALGVGALLAASQTAYAVLRWAGAAYLLWVGYKLLRNPRQAFAAEAPRSGSAASPFATGVLTNLLNPKVGLFYVSFLPQFVPPDVPAGAYMFLLGGIHAALGLIWFACLIAATRPIAAWLKRPAVVQACDRLTGGVFIAFGVTLALGFRRP